MAGGPRDRERIDRMLKKLRRCWVAQPEMQLAPLVAAVTREVGLPLDLAAVQDGTTEAGLDAMIVRLDAEGRH